MYTKNKIGNGFLCISKYIDKIAFSLPYKYRILQYQYKIEKGGGGLACQECS